MKGETRDNARMYLSSNRFRLVRDLLEVVLACTAHWTDPIVGYVFKLGSWFHSAVRVSLFFVIDPATD